MFTFDLTPLDPGSHEVALSPSASDLALDTEVFSDIEIVLRIDLGQDRALVRFDARGIATLTCDRTLEPYRQAIQGEHTVLFLAPNEFGSGEDRNGRDEFQVLPEPGVPIDLTEPVRDTLLLAVPARRVAPGAEERAIPTVFHDHDADDDDAVDPRWEALRRLRDPNS